MNLQNFSNNFDTYINAYNQRQDFGQQDALAFSEYEKSVFLTRAQEKLVISYYTGRNNNGSGFEQTEEVRRYLSNLVKEVRLKPITTTNGLPLGVSSTSRFFSLPEDLWFITYESAKVSSNDCHDGSTLDVIPVTQDEYHKIKRNPFRGASSRRVLRLDLANDVVELVSIYQITNYYVRYLTHLSPIILIDLPDDLTINNVAKATECKLHEVLHEKILELAVQEAIMSKSITANRDTQ